MARDRGYETPDTFIRLNTRLEWVDRIAEIAEEEEKKKFPHGLMSLARTRRFEGHGSYRTLSGGFSPHGELAREP